MVASIEPECIPMFIPFSSDIRISFTPFGLQSEYDTFSNILRYSTKQHTIQSKNKKQIEKKFRCAKTWWSRTNYIILIVRTWLLTGLISILYHTHTSKIQVICINKFIFLFGTLLNSFSKSRYVSTAGSIRTSCHVMPQVCWAKLIVWW